MQYLIHRNHAKWHVIRLKSVANSFGKNDKFTVSRILTNGHPCQNLEYTNPDTDPDSNTDTLKNDTLSAFKISTHW